jgi:hypothetical protein
MRSRVSAPVPKRCEETGLIVCPVGATKPKLTKLEERVPSPHDGLWLFKRDSFIQPAAPFLNALPKRPASRKVCSLVDDPLHRRALASLPRQGDVAQGGCCAQCLNISRQSISIQRRGGLLTAGRRLNLKKEQQP